METIPSAPTSELAEEFIKQYALDGFETRKQLPLMINDGTVVYASCTASNYRQEMEGLESSRSVTLQKCLRLQSLKYLHKNELDPWTCYFTMIGGFDTCNEDTSTETAKKHINKFLDIMESVDVSSKNIAVVASNTTANRWNLPESEINLSENPFGQESLIPLNAKSGEPLFVYIPDDKSQGLRWDYDDGITGEGVSLYIHGPDKIWRQVGNIILTQNINQQSTGIEFGGGLEAMYSAINGLQANHLASGMIQSFGLDDSILCSPQAMNMLNALEAGLQISNCHTDNLDEMSVGFLELQNVARVLHSHVLGLGLRLHDIEILSKRYISDRSLNKNASDIVLNLLDARRKDVIQFMGRKVVKPEFIRFYNARVRQRNNQPLQNKIMDIGRKIASMNTSSLIPGEKIEPPVVAEEVVHYINPALRFCRTAKIHNRDIPQHNVVIKPTN